MDITLRVPLDTSGLQAGAWGELSSVCVRRQKDARRFQRWGIHALDAFTASMPHGRAARWSEVVANPFLLRPVASVARQADGKF